jgi:hypothetical protein
MLVCSTPLVNERPSNLLTGSPVFLQCVTGGGGGSGCVESIYRSYNTVFDQIPNLQNCFTTPNKNLGEKERALDTDKHLPLSPFKGKFLRKADI